DSNLHDAGGDPEKVLRNSVFQDSNAKDQLAGAKIEGKWHSVGPLAFGKRRLHRAGVLAAGDSAGMIDPFTGTGIQVALRSGEMLAEAVFQGLGGATTTEDRGPALSVTTYLKPSNSAISDSLTEDNAGLINSIRSNYEALYAKEFGGRMRVASLLRRVAFSQPARSVAAAMFATLPWLTRQILRATRPI
ncbi:MAG: NAD(P)/FAD-dependent oxidoreductase, partial [Blastocatellia bacterium]